VSPCSAHTSESKRRAKGLKALAFANAEKHSVTGC
jgi:hypothetical protein